MRRGETSIMIVQGQQFAFIFADGCARMATCILPELDDSPTEAVSRRTLLWLSPAFHRCISHCCWAFRRGTGRHWLHAHMLHAGCSIQEVLHYVDNSIQYGEDADVKIRDFDNGVDGDDD